MDGLTWLIVSWLVVGALCYLMLAKLGAPQTELTTETHATAPSLATSSSKWSGDERSAADWLNDIIGWLFHKMHRVPGILQAWIAAMNEAAKKISPPGKCEVLFEGFGDNENVAKAPRITNVRLQQAPNDHLIIRSNISIPEVNLKLVSSQRMDDRLLVTNYDAKIIDFYGEVELRMACIASQVYVMACLCGRPELDIQLVNRDSSSTGTVSSTLVDEMIRKCLLSAVTNISLTEPGGQRGAAPTGIFPTIPHANVASGVGNSNSSVMAPVQEMVKRISQSAQLANQVAKLQGTPNKMRVKVIRAQRLGGERTVNQPYVVLEMDEPAQKFQTSRGLNMSPYWEESFEFELTPASEEILFEIYEAEAYNVVGHGHAGHPSHTEPEDDLFLGLAIVSLEELRRSNTNTAHTLKLQGRPYRNDKITGNLTVQFDFYHDPTIVSMGKQVDQTIVRNTVDQFRETVSSTRRPIYDPHDSFEAHDIQEVVPTKTTTVTVKTVSQSPSDKAQSPMAPSGITMVQQPLSTATAVRPQQLQQQYPGQKSDHVGIAVQYDTKISTNEAQQQKHTPYGAVAQQQPFELSGQQQQQHYTSKAVATSSTSDVTGQQQQSGSTTNNRLQQHVVPGNSIGTVTDKAAQHFLAEAKGQQVTDSGSYSYQRYEKQGEAPIMTSKTNIAEISSTGETDEMRQSRDREKKSGEEKLAGKRDRSFFSELRDRLSGRRRSKKRAKSCDIVSGELEEAVSLPPSRDPSRTRFPGAEKPGSRSHDSVSYGGKSERSTKSLYQHSTLLLEVHEDGQQRYYLIPPAMLNEPAAMKLLREGKKLHVYNDHTFVAVKSKSGTVCNVCHQRIGRSSFSKQAYQCRDCRLVCHKQCHYKAESYCTASNLSKLHITKDIDWAHFLTSYQIDEFISEDGV